MPEDNYNLQHVINLAELFVDENQKEKYVGQLQSIFDYMKVLNQLDLSKVEPTSFASNEPTLLREDEIRIFKNIDLSKNAPLLEENFFQVPKILV